MDLDCKSNIQVKAQTVQFEYDTWSHSLKVWPNVLAWPFFENPHERSERSPLLITHFFSQYDDYISQFLLFHSVLSPEQMVHIILDSWLFWDE